MNEKIEYLRKFNKSARLMQLDEISDTYIDMIPDIWRDIFSENNAKNRIQKVLENWRKYSGRELSITISYLYENLENIELLEIEGRHSTRYSILYTIKKPNNEICYYEGRNPKEKFHNDELEQNWSMFPESIQQFYENVHNGFYYYASVSMGLLPFEFIPFLGDDDFDWSIINDLKEPLQIDLNTSFGFFSNGMGSYIAIDYNNCSDVNATFWSAKTQPKYNINFWDHVDEWIVIGFE
ncbi:superoxide dismutase [Paenibacillus glacialis]|uniref:Superoxide dismutase n=1 Tax=Paenibacillus glacialis TaxID=494026 RepID=A0A168EA13_9BACL|nr:superoxide dismutase [Paenibacillus glacialis]OAB35021.1 superoxide dismutase [Paenibacillus glacialis]